MESATTASLSAFVAARLWQAGKLPEAVAIVALIATTALVDKVMKGKPRVRVCPVPCFRPGAAPGLMLGCTSWPLAFAAQLLTYPSLANDINGLFWSSCVVSSTALLACLFSGSPGRFRTAFQILVNASLLCYISWLSGVSTSTLFVVNFIFLTLVRFAVEQLRFSFTAGEATMMCCMLSLVLSNFALSLPLQLAHALSKRFPEQVAVARGPSGFLQLSPPPLLDSVKIGTDLSVPQSLLSLAFLLGLCLRSHLVAVAATQRRRAVVDVQQGGDAPEVVRFYTALAAFVALVAYPVMWLAARGQDPFYWLLRFLVDVTHNSALPRWLGFVHPHIAAGLPVDMFLRLELVLVWLAVLYCGVFLRGPWSPFALASSLPRILARKYYHLLAVLLFAPAIILDSRFVSLAFAVATAIFVFAEYLRAASVPPFGPAIDEFVRTYLDSRDQGVVVLSHTYLLLGCALPVWMHQPIINSRTLAHTQPDSAPLQFTYVLLPALVGVLVLGIGDTAASVFGLRCGRHRWPGSRKTFEGTAGAVVAMLLVAAAFYWLSSVLKQPFPKGSAATAHLSGLGLDMFNLFNFASASASDCLMAMQTTLWPVVAVVVATVAAAVLEATTSQSDNLFLGLFFYTVLVSVL